MEEKRENEEEDKGLKAPSKCKYLVYLLIITAILVGEGIVIVSLMTKYKSTINETEMLNKKYEQNLAELEKIENIINEMSVTATSISLEEYNKLSREISSLRSELFEHDDSSLYRDITNTMQYQYDNFTGNLTIILTVIGSIIAILTIVFPLFNYAFLNKDQLDSMNKKVKELINSMDIKVDEKVTELNKKIDYNIGKLQNDVKEAKKSADKAIAAAKNSEKSLENVNKKYIEIEKQVQEVVKASKKASESEKESKINSLFSKTYNSKNLKEKIEIYSEILELNPKHVLAYNNRGIVYYKKGEYDKAIADFDKAIELDPKDPGFYLNRGNAYKNKREYDKAIADFDKAIELDPEYKEAYNNRGIAYKNRGEYNKAIADYDKAIELDPEYKEAYNNRGITYSKKGNYDKAKKDFDHAIKLDPEYSYTYGSLAEMYSDMDNKEEFYKYLEISLSKKYPLKKIVEEEKDTKKQYDKYKGEKRFKDLMEKYDIDYPFE